MTRRTAAAVMAAAAALAFVAGCGKSSTQGTATPTTTDKAAAEAALWDPCAISSDTLQKLGVDQSSRDVGIGGVHVTGWKDCTWLYPPDHSQSLTIWSTIYSIDDFKKKTDNTNFVPISVDGRDGWKFHRVTDKDNEKCDLAFPASSGGAYQISFYNLDPGMAASPCDGAMKAANVAVPLFPR